MLAARRKMLAYKATPRPLFTSLTGGMQQMADALVARLSSASLAAGQRVLSVNPQTGGWQVTLEQGTRDFDCIILAVPAHVSAALLRSGNPPVASELKGIDYTSSITINLGYTQKVRECLPSGFGFLVPRSQQRRMLACTFVHTKFPHRTPANRALLRCFMAVSDNEQFSESDDRIVDVIRTELRAILGLNAEPLFSRVYRWDRAMAQYAVGHLERLERIEQLRPTTPGLFLAGNAYKGIGVPDCIRSGNEAATSALSFLGLTTRISVSQPA
jgi:oxygen-dependent protoporphyrinogen oxidase